MQMNELVRIPCRTWALLSCALVDLTPGLAALGLSPSPLTERAARRVSARAGVRLARHQPATPSSGRMSWLIP